MSSGELSAPEFLEKKNFKALIEFITAQVLFKRPEDPLKFVGDVIAAKLAERDSTAYDPDANDKYLQETYNDPHLSVAPTEAVGAGAAAEFRDEAVEKRLALLEKVIAASRSIAMQLDPAEATRNIITESCNILSADRATLFRLDEGRKELELLVAEGADSIFVPLGKGIAGTVASTGEVINIPDAYKDDRFDSSHDAATGYKTTSILCAPVRDGTGTIVGVVQAINSSNGSFSELDAEVFSVLAGQAGIALRNAELYYSSLVAREKVTSMLDIIKAMHNNLGINSLMFTITTRAHKMVDADRCTFFIANHHTSELWAMQGEVDIRIPIDKGIAGAVATDKETINIPDAYADSRFNQEVDKASGYTTRTILCMPLLGSGGKVVGVIQLINKATGVFTTEDEELMGSFLSLAAPIIENSQLFQHVSSEKEEGNEFTGRSLMSPASKAPSLPAMTIEEGDEEEEDDE